MIPLPIIAAPLGLKTLASSTVLVIGALISLKLLEKQGSLLHNFFPISTNMVKSSKKIDQARNNFQNDNVFYMEDYRKKVKM